MRWFNSLLFLLLTAVTAHAAYVVSQSGRQINGTTISATADGSVTLTTASGQIMTFRKGQYRSAAADRPKELTEAEALLKSGKGKQAVPLLRQVKEQCRFLAWDQKAVQLLADYYYASGQFAEAIAEFQSLEDQSSPSNQRKLREALMKSGETESVLSALNQDIASGSREAAAQAYLMRGELNAANGDVEGARRDWLKVVLFFKAQKELAQDAEHKLGNHEIHESTGEGFFSCGSWSEYFEGEVDMKWIWMVMWLATAPVFAQEAEIVKSDAVQAAEAVPEPTSGFLDVVKGGGGFGIFLWLGLAGLSLAAGALIVDSALNIRETRIIPKTLVSLVREAIEDGSLKKAAQRCKDVPGPYSNILLAGFENYEDGSDTAQDAIGIAADMESEKMLQRVNYLNVVGNLAPMLGLLGTVQGMILAFATLGTTSGAAKNALLAINISQALYTTAAGLVIAVPAIGSYFFFRNRAAKVILTMESLTMEVMKGLKNQKPENE